MSITFNVKNVEIKNSNLVTFNILNFAQNHYKKQKISDTEYFYQEYRKLDQEKLPEVEKEKRFSQLVKDCDEYKIKLQKLVENVRVLSSSFKNENNKNSNDSKNYEIEELKSIGPNSFVHSCWKAYNLHHHLEIRPDDIFMAIMVQFSLYVNKHSESFRDRLVDFQGKQLIEVLTDDPILVAQHDKLTLELINKMKSCIKDPSIASWLVPDFTTTTQSDKVAYSAVLLSTMKKFFDYSMKTRCGLPSVTLLGTIEDWTNIKERLQKLKEFNLDDNLMDKWVTLLEPIIDQFILTASGNPNLDWWNSMIDYEQRSGGDSLTGWITCFICFDNDGNWIESQDSNNVWPKISSNKIANGYVDVPILLIDGDGTQYKSTLFSGHIAASKTSDQTKIKPSIDWFLLLDPSDNVTPSY